MFDITKRRQFARYVGLALLIGACISSGAVWARRAGFIDRLSEDVFQLLAWCSYLLPLGVFLRPGVGSRAIRRAIYICFFVILVLRLADVADQVPALNEIPILGSNSSFHSAAQRLLWVMSGASILVVIYLLFDEFAARTTSVRESNARYQNLFDNMPTVCFTFDRTGRILSWNRAAEIAYGYTAEEAIGADAATLIGTPESMAATRRMVADVFQGQASLVSEWLDRAKSGQVGRRLGHAFPLLRDEGGVECGVSMSVDITERRQAEADLAQARHERELIVDHVPALVARVDRDARYRYVNRRYAEWFGSSTEDLAGLRLQDHLDADYESLAQHVEAVLQGVPRHFDHEFVREQGNRWAQVSMVPDLDEREGCVGFYLMVKDVTEQKVAEREAENERVLLRKLLDLQERERQTVTHDIHDGIVQYVVGAQMQVEACGATLDPHDAATTAKLELASKHLREAVREGRRLISGLRPPIIDEAGLVAAIDHLIGELSRSDEIHVAFEHSNVGRDLPPFLESALFRIVQEALTNVNRHSAARSAHVQLRRDGEIIRLDVRDSGRGFLRRDVPESRFGLRGIEERARLFGGKAQIESTPGHGTRIHVEMPLHADDDLSKGAGPVAQGVASNGASSANRSDTASTVNGGNAHGVGSADHAKSAAQHAAADKVPA